MVNDTNENVKPDPRLDAEKGFAVSEATNGRNDSGKKEELLAIIFQFSPEAGFNPYFRGNTFYCTWGCTGHAFSQE